MNEIPARDQKINNEKQRQRIHEALRVFSFTAFTIFNCLLNFHFSSIQTTMDDDEDYGLVGFFNK